jgi:hypothetical protein
VGYSDTIAATEFIADLESRLSNRIQLTSDGLKLYVNAVKERQAKAARRSSRLLTQGLRSGTSPHG